jgi:hypothetical protein
MMINLSTVHWIPNSNRYRYNFASPLDLRGKTAKLLMYQYSIYNSSYNISKALGNNTYSITWVDGNTYNFTIDDGYYSFSDLNAHLITSMTKYKLYLSSTSTSGLSLFFMDIKVNSIQYAAQVDINYVPNTMPSGYSYASGSTWSLPSSPKYPQLTVCDGLKTLLGMNVNSFPTSQIITGNPSNLGFLSTSYPVVSPCFCYVITCNFLSSSVSQVPTIFCNIPLTASYGNLITNNFSNSAGISVYPAIYNYIELTILDQSYNTAQMKDPELTISLILEVQED